MDGYKCGRGGLIMNLTIDIEEKVSQVIMTLAGEIDIYTAPKLKDKLNELVSSKNADVIVDLQGVSYMDSTGLGTFVSGLKHAEDSESKLKLIGANERLLRLFQVTGLDDVIDVSSAEEGDLNG